MSTGTATITCYGEPDVRYIVPSPSLHHMEDAVGPQLSSPLSSYEFDSGPEGVSLKHHETYPLRLQVLFFTDIYGYVVLCDLLQSAKATVSELESRLNTRRGRGPTTEGIPRLGSSYSCCARCIYYLMLVASGNNDIVRQPSTTPIPPLFLEAHTQVSRLLDMATVSFSLIPRQLRSKRI